MAEAPAPHRHRGTRAVQRMVEYAPATGGLALWVQHEDVPADELQAAAPLLTTDGHTLRYHRAFADQPLPAQIGLVAHAVLHVGLRHPQRYLALRGQVGDVDLRLFNLCADAIVNSALGHLGWLALPASALRLEALLDGALGLTVTAEAALLDWDVERLYRAIDDRPPPAAGGRSPQTGGSAEPQPTREDGPRAAAVRLLGSGSPPDLAPGTQRHQTPARAPEHAPEAEAQQDREWRERLLRAHASDGEFSMLRNLLADLPRSRTPWEPWLRTQLARALSRQRALSWSRPARSYIANQGRAGPHRRLPWEPGSSASKAVPRVVVVVDVSGSIKALLMDRFAREIEAITRRQEAGLVLVIGDDQVRRVARFEPGRSELRDIVFDGGGGTDFTPLLEEADRHRPDLVVVLTDLQGPALYRPRCPVVWAVPEAHAAAVAPFGRVLCLA